MSKDTLVYDGSGIIIKIGGLENLRQRLDELELSIKRRMLVTGLKRALVPMLTMAETMAPIRTGKLSKSFKIIKPRSDNPYILEVRLINTAFYSRWVEYGHKIVIKRKGKKVTLPYRTRPNPYMRTTFNVMKEKVIEEVANQISLGLMRRGV